MGHAVSDGQLWKRRQEEARQSRNALTQIAFDCSTVDESYQICFDTVCLLFRKYTVVHDQKGDALDKSRLTEDTRVKPIKKPVKS